MKPQLFIGGSQDGKLIAVVDGVEHVHVEPPPEPITFRFIDYADSINQMTFWYETYVWCSDRQAYVLQGLEPNKQEQS